MEAQVEHMSQATVRRTTLRRMTVRTRRVQDRVEARSRSIIG
jgi:hypothetical protein